MPNKIKHNQTKRNQICRLYAIQRTDGGEYEDGTRYSSKGKYTLRQISEKTGVPIASVSAIAKGIR